MSGFPTTPLRWMAEAALGADLTASPLTYTTWTDVSAYVLALDKGGALTSRHGRADEFSTAPQSSGTATMINNDGRWTERYPLGAWYGLIGRNTPLRWLLSPDVNAATDAFGRTTSNGWGTTDSGQAWTVVGTAGDYSTTSGVARVTHGTAAVRHYGVLPASQLTFDVTVRIRTGALATGAALSAGVVWHYADANNSNRFDVLFGTDQTISVRAAIRSAGVDSFGASHTVALTHAANTFYWLRVQSHSPDARRVRAKVWLDGTTQPTTWAGYSTINGNLTAGLTGLTSTRETGNTNASATVDFDDLALTDGWYPRHTGYIDSLPRRWPDHSASVTLTPITASGMTRRLQQGGVIRSALKAAVLAQSPGPRAYWAMEDGSSATQIASSLPGGQPMTIAGAESLGSARAAGSDPVVTVSNTGLLRGQVPSYSGTDWTVMWLINVPAAVASEQALLRWQTSGTYPTWQLVLTPQAGDDLITLRAYDQNLVEQLGDTGITFADTTYGTQLWIEVSAQQVGGNIAWSYQVWVSDIGIGRSSTKAGTAGTVTQVSFGNGAGANLLQGATLGHISVWDNATMSLGIFASEGFGTEKSTTRLARLGAQEHVTVQTPATPTYDFAVLGPPTSSTLLTQLREIETAELGVLFDDLDGAITLVPRESRINQAVALTLDLALGQVGPGFAPDNDDQQLMNDATSSQPNGTSYRYSDTGVNGVTARGYYSKPFAPNLAYAPDLRQDAEFRTAIGTVDDDRYTVVPLDLAGNPSLILAWLNCTVGSRIQVINTASLFTPDPIDLIIEGWEERQSNVDWKVDIYTSSAKPWNAWILETGTGNQSRLDSGTSLLAAAATSAATALVVTTSDQLDAWTTLAADFPFDTGVAGERVTVGSSGVSGIAPTLLDTFTRTTASGWGTPDNGPAWTTSGGSASDYSTNGSQGVHNLSTTVTQRESMTAVGLGPATAVGVNPALTVEVYADWIHVPTAPTGGTVTVSLIACRSDANNYVALQLFFQAGGTVTVAVEQVVAGVVTAQDSTFPSVGAVGSTFSARLVVSPTAIQGRVWVRGTTEQTSTWSTSVATTATPGAGSIVWRTERAVGNTNVAPYFIELDGLQLPKTQTFTVARAVNGVAKAQAPGWRVGLWNPSVLAL